MQTNSNLRPPSALIDTGVVGEQVLKYSASPAKNGLPGVYKAQGKAQGKGSSDHGTHNLATRWPG